MLQSLLDCGSGIWILLDNNGFKIVHKEKKATEYKTHKTILQKKQINLRIVKATDSADKLKS